LTAKALTRTVARHAGSHDQTPDMLRAGQGRHKCPEAALLVGALQIAKVRPMPLLTRLPRRSV